MDVVYHMRRLGQLLKRDAKALVQALDTNEGRGRCVAA